MKSANFKVHPKLAELLGETYRSLEEATKELIDNSYDADSEEVRIVLPEAFKENPQIIISDNGSGMKENEVRTEYLNIANSRTSRKGSISFQKKRKVKGRKGIGKFSGLMIAQIMELETSVAGQKTTLTINKDDLALAGYDLEKVPLPINTEKCDIKLHGTKITLKGLNQNYNFPNPERLKEFLVRDYGRENDFRILINDNDIGVLDLQGKSFSENLTLSNGKKALLNYTITQKQVKGSGIAIRVNNKIIGRPHNFLSDDNLIPKKLQSRIYGEIVCDDLEEDITADFGAIIENSKLFQNISEETKEKLTASVNDIFKTDMKMAKARFQQKINQELQKLPEYKQPFAKKALYKTLEKFYGESDTKINTVISVMISAMEKDHYWDIIYNIQETRDSDIENFADALCHFGLLEMSIITTQTINRLKYLDELNLLIENTKTLEKTVHKAIEKSTWILGDDYNVIFSDISFEKAISSVLDKKYSGEKSLDRPDLLLGRKLNKELVLIEFKRPNYTLNRDTERQALEYRDELNMYFHNQHIEIILIGGRIKQNISSHNERDDVKFRTYLDIISVARNRLTWLIQELKIENPSG
jgi:hypothetical protein